jgi:D-alanyl-D-alanine carboxypeptidase
MVLVEMAHQKPQFSCQFLRRMSCVLLLALATVVLVASGLTSAEAKPRLAAMAVDARTGKILFSKDADGLRYPASLTKVMTLYVLFQDLKTGRVKLDTPLRVSKRAAGMAPSKLGLKPGSTITVENAIKALVTKSANDVAATVAENLASSESVFASRMTKVARSIGMSRSTFRNASGLPHSGQMTTARDMATLSLRIQRDFPQYYPYFRITSFVYKGRVIRSHNRLLGRFDGTDGIKTGYTRAAGFNLTSSVKRGGKRVVGVVMGASSTGARNSFMMKMLEASLPKCTPGSTIAALAGSSKGAIDPIQTIKQKPKGVLAIKEKASEPEVANVQPDEPQTTEVGDTDEETAEGSTDRQGIAELVRKSGEPTVLEATLADSETVDTQSGSNEPLPFAVKSASASGGGKVLVELSPDAWKIQLGAYPNKRDAQALLKKARSTGGSALAGKQAFTVQVQSGAETIYRARFSGFSEEGAHEACRQLEAKGMACLTLAPQS